MGSGLLAATVCLTATDVSDISSVATTHRLEQVEALAPIELAAASPKDASNSFFRQIAMEGHERLVTLPCQWLIALIATIVGAVMLYDGEFCIHWITIQ